MKNDANKGFYQLREALESAGFKQPEPANKNVDDFDLDDNLPEHEYQERRRLFTT